MLTHVGTKTIETPRLILRRAREADAQPMFQNWASDPEVTKFLTWPTHDNVAVTQWVVNDWVSQSEKDNYYQWMIELKDLEQPIGSISVVQQNDTVGEMEIGYCIGKNWWHQGIVTEALGAVINFLFTQANANRIEAKHDTKNPNSGAVMRKCGMVFEGISRAGGRNNLGLCDIANYAILRSDWEK